MHDIDTTRLEAAPQFEDEIFETYESALHEEDEESLTAELLGVSGEDEMNQFLGGLFKSAAKAIGGSAAKFIKKNAGTLAGALKSVAKSALPLAGGALGTMIPIPGVGTALGSALGGAAANLLEAQTQSEAYTGEEEEVKRARNFVRLAGNVIRHGAKTAARPMPPKAAVLNALRAAIAKLRRQVAANSTAFTQNNYNQMPAGTDWSGSGDIGGGFVDAEPASQAPSADFVDDPSGSTTTAEGENEYLSPANTRARSGRWVRRGGHIVLLGI